MCQKIYLNVLFPATGKQLAAGVPITKLSGHRIPDADFLFINVCHKNAPKRTGRRGTRTDYLHF